MKYNNPVLSGFYPDPSVCHANGKFYMVCSSFQYFPGVPLFESDNLVNWKQIGYVLTRTNQVALEKVNSSGGVFAPTIRYNDGRFYMVTTNDTTHENFYVYTDDIYGEWSDPITVEQDGIDPSLYFEDGRTYFMSNGSDDEGKGGVVQCEIDIATGKKLSPSKCIWQGSGGRFLESPHLYKINGYYYLMAAEGGTEYGHMITLARADSVWGEFETYADNPILTNRNKAPCIIQGIGHGDLIQDKNGDWHILSLGFRQIHMWMTFHTLGREVFLTPVKFTDDGWIKAGVDGTTDESYEIKGDFVQNVLPDYTFANTDPHIDWCFLRFPDPKNYELSADSYILHGTDITLDAVGSPTFIALRQREFCFELSVDVQLDGGEAGVTMYMCEQEHFEVALRQTDSGHEAILRLNIGGVHHIENAVPVSGNSAKLTVRADNLFYKFSVSDCGKETFLGMGQAKYLSTEVAGGFTGVMTGLYAVGENTAKFTEFLCSYKN
ncbi:MAG: glycoside hydrolase family 43 protein [Eubacterium sp.]|nr:glycoside hydrolase family 43 protein [Eubacterium sp.]